MTLTQRKKPVQRLYNRLVGLPPEPEAATAPPFEPTPVKPIAEPSVQPQSATKAPVKGRCLKHGELTPCQICLVNALRAESERETRAANRKKQQEYVDLINPINAALYEAQEEIRKAIAERIRPDQKCVHGMYLAKHYCEVCRWEPIDPGYDAEIYRVEINKALRYAKFLLSAGESFVKRQPVQQKESDEIEPRLEGQKDFEDLVSLVDLEIWNATKFYGDKMNAAIAYTVARNQRGKFLADRIEEQTILVVDSDGNPVLDEFGQAEGLNGAELMKKSEDPNVTPEEQKEAKKLLERYAQRIPRFKSMDDRPENEEGGDLGTTKAELAVIGGRAIGGPAQGDDEFSAVDIESLQRFVGTWHGDIRRVAAAMLKPGFTVRGVPGLDKSKVSRIRPVVARAF